MRRLEGRGERGAVVHQVPVRPLKGTRGKRRGEGRAGVVG